MLNKYKRDFKTYVKQLPNYQSLIKAKTAIYFALAAYWGLILIGTFYNI